MARREELSVINSALTCTGENIVGVEGAGSQEWITASDAYETGLSLLIEARSWSFGKTTATLVRTGASPAPASPTASPNRAAACTCCRFG